MGIGITKKKQKKQKKLEQKFETEWATTTTTTNICGPGTQHMSSSRVLENRSVCPMGNIQRQCHRRTCRWPAAATPLGRCGGQWLSCSISTRSDRQRCENPRATKLGASHEEKDRENKKDNNKEKRTVHTRT